jgi:ribosomal protein L35
MKRKTRKSLSKRVRLTGTKSNRWGKKAKLVHKTAGQSHFNAREASKTTTLKRRTRRVDSTDHKNILRQLPYA